jgi:hypothetical protein
MLNGLTFSSLIMKVLCADYGQKKKKRNVKKQGKKLPAVPRSGEDDCQHLKHNCPVLLGTRVAVLHSVFYVAFIVVYHRVISFPAVTFFCDPPL